MIRQVFPLVTCDAHPHATARPGWLLCAHIARDVHTVIEHLQTPTRDRLGQILCPECYAEFRTLDDFILACPDCVADILRARELRP